MRFFSFLENWGISEKRFYYAIFLCFTFVCLGAALLYFLDINTVLDWEILYELERIPVKLYTYKDFPLDVNVPVDNYIINQYFDGSTFIIKPWTSYLFLSCITTGICLLLTAVTALKRFWYGLGITLFIIILIGFRFDHLLLLGNTKNTGLIAAFLLYLPVSFYFHAFNKKVPHWLRFCCFLLISILMGVFISIFSEVSYPFLYLANHSLIAALIISGIFILMVSHEIIYGLIYLISSSGTNGKKSFSHVIIISFIFLFYVVVSYLHNRMRVSWNILYLDAFFLLLVASFVGVWGLNKRIKTVEGSIPFYPDGAISYLALGIITFATITYAQITANDPIIESFEDIILASHFSFGLIFIIYIVANFYDLFYRNLPVFKVLYKPSRMPYFTYRLAGILTLAAFLLQSEMLPVNQAIAGYYNIKGDIAYLSANIKNPNSLKIAKAYYTLGSHYGYSNHRSNFALASISSVLNDKEALVRYYEKAINKKPSPQAYINLSNIYNAHEMYYKSLFTLKDGIQSFPRDRHIQNNLGLLYEKIQFPDSAFLCFEKHKKDLIMSSNMLALLARLELGKSLDLDSVWNSKKRGTSFKNNVLVLANQTHHEVDFPIDMLNDTVLSPTSFAFLYNLAYNQLNTNNSLAKKAINKILLNPNKTTYYEDLRFIVLLDDYKNFYINDATKGILELKGQTSTYQKRYYNYLLGLWGWEQQADMFALAHFKEAQYPYDPYYAFYYTIALLKTGQTEKANIILEPIKRSKEDPVSTFASKISKCLQFQTYKQLLNDATDEEKFLGIKFRKDLLLNDSSYLALIQSIKLDHFKVYALNHAIKYFLKIKDFDTVKKLLTLSEKNVIDAPLIVYSLQKAKLQLLLVENKDKLFLKEFKKIKWHNHLDKLFYQAIVFQKKGKVEKAKSLFVKIMHRNAFFEDAIVYGSDFLNKNGADPLLVYDLLLDATLLNKTSIEVKKCYILQCAQLGLDTYAQDALDDLQSMLSKEAYHDFIVQYEYKKSTFNHMLDEWN